jgi:hypothetical protein
MRCTVGVQHRPLLSVTVSAATQSLNSVPSGGHPLCHVQGAQQAGPGPQEQARQLKESTLLHLCPPAAQVSLTMDTSAVAGGSKHHHCQLPAADSRVLLSSRCTGFRPAAGGWEPRSMS